MFIEATLNKSAGWGANQRAGYIESSDDAVHLGVSAAKAVGKLHRAEQKRAGCGHAVRQKPPLERLIVVPNGIAALIRNRSLWLRT